jgi:hypothetical protein
MLSSDPSSSTSPKIPVKTEEQQVFIGIFPASHIHVRDQLSDAEDRLPGVAAALNKDTNGCGPGSDAIAQWNKERERAATRSETSKDDHDEDEAAKKAFKLGPPPEQANSSRAGLTVYSSSIRSRASSLAESQILKPLPPRPSLKSGDDTAAGAVQPIVDEIASALREWHMLMFQYLARRDYKLFHIVQEHIEALHLGRRQLLAQTLSAEETVNLRRECVARLVSGNVIQGLDVIVRHPTWGGLATVDVEGETDPRSWVSAIRMYAMQTCLAYLDVQNDSGSKPTALGPSAGDHVGPSPTPANSAFPDYPPFKYSRSLGNFSVSNPPPHDATKTSAKFYHIFLDLRAFVASPCSPGETAELFFSLYNKAETKFVTEEFCAVLNHNGVLARDPTARIRTLFTDLAQSDVQDPLYLVCRIVRNGALKIGTHMSSGAPAEGGRRASDGPTRVDLTVTESGTSSTTYGSGRGAFSSDPMQFRRPFGCAVLELTQLAKMTAEQSDISPTMEHTMPIFIPTNEALFSMLHQDIIANNVKEFEKSSRYAVYIIKRMVLKPAGVDSKGRDAGFISEDFPRRCADHYSRKYFVATGYTTNTSPRIPRCSFPW